MCYERTDMAIESSALFNKKTDEIQKLDGVEVIEEKHRDIHLTKVIITNEDGEKSIGKPIGEYITIDLPGFVNLDDEFKTNIIKIISSNLKNILADKMNSGVFVVGLGNKKITPDALGPKVVEGINVTRHLYDEATHLIDDTNTSACAISPGVLGITGIETAEIIKGIVDKIKPSVVICIDALATRSIHRLSSSVQISNTGITPGAGVGNRRHTINESTLGVPVIAIGVPTVIDGATIVNDSMSMLIEAINNFSSEKSKGFIEKMDREHRYALVSEILKPYETSLIVTPKEVDLIIEETAMIISSAINYALGNDI